MYKDICVLQLVTHGHVCFLLQQKNLYNLLHNGKMIFMKEKKSVCIVHVVVVKQ